MRKFITVFWFEFKNMITRRSVIISTLIISLVFIGIASIPTIFPSIFNTENHEEEAEVVLFENVGFYLTEETKILAEIMAIEDAFIFDDVDELKQAILDSESEVKYGFVLKSWFDYDYLVTDKSMYDTNQTMFENVLHEIILQQRFVELGVSSEDYLEAKNITFVSKVEVLGVDGSGGSLFLIYFYIFSLYMMIITYGATVSITVAREKDNRTMELLITSTKPRILIMGKVFAAGLSGMLQVVIIVISLIVGVLLNLGNYPDFVLELLNIDVSLQLMLVFTLFFISGYILYLFIYAALGSLVSKIEDVNNAVAPITFLSIIAYVLSSIAMNLPDSSFTAVTSYIPFVSLYTMPIRFLLTSVSWLEIILSLVIMIVTTVLIAEFSIYIYRFGSLNYGNRLKIRDVLRSFKKNK